LSYFDIDELVKKMAISNFEGCFYEDTLKKIEPSSSYIIINEKNERNAGSGVNDRWFTKAIYMDSYGEKEHNEIRIFLLKSNQYKIAHNQ